MWTTPAPAPDTILNLVNPFVEANIRDAANWRSRDVTILVFGSVLDVPPVEAVKGLFKDNIKVLIDTLTRDARTQHCSQGNDGMGSGTRRHRRPRNNPGTSRHASGSPQVDAHCVVGNDFTRYIGSIMPVFLQALGNLQHWQLCTVAVGATGEVCGALGKDMSPFADKIVLALLEGVKRS